MAVLCVLSSLDAFAFSTAYPVNCTSTVAMAALQGAIDSSSPGQVICSQPGSGNVTFDIPGNKDIVVAGAAAWGGGTTTMTSGSINQHNVGAATGGSRITGFTITGGTIPLGYMKGIAGYRIDHMTLTMSTWQIVWYNIGSQSASDPNGSDFSRYRASGLFDHITCTNCRVVAYGEWTGTGANSQGGRVRWSESDTFGDVNCLYVEDSIFVSNSTGIDNSIDGNTGGCYVFRFNTVTDSYAEMHSVQGTGNRGTKRWEVYGNTFTANTVLGFKPLVRIRGGSGLIWNNYWIDGVQTWGGSAPRSLLMDNVRSNDNTRWDGFCGDGAGGDGTAPIDENTPGRAGGLCRDQPGAGQDAFLWTSNGAGVYNESPTSLIPSQQHTPMYFFGSKIGTGPVPSTAVGATWLNDQNPVYTLSIVQNREWFIDVGANCSGASCSTGVGSGTLANRPANCTTGTAYWATDQGSWNTSTSNPQGVQFNGADGILHRCKSTNVWEVYYLPYIYPHPLQGGTGDTTPPSAPTNLRLVTLTYNTAMLAWDASSDDTAVTGYLIERCLGASCSSFAQVGAPTVISYTDTPLRTVSSYSWRVRATDAAGNLSSYSSTVTSVTDSAKFNHVYNLRRTGFEPSSNEGDLR